MLTVEKFLRIYITVLFWLINLIFDGDRYSLRAIITVIIILGILDFFKLIFICLKVFYLINVNMAYVLISSPTPLLPTLKLLSLLIGF